MSVIFDVVRRVCNYAFKEHLKTCLTMAQCGCLLFSSVEILFLLTYLLSKLRYLKTVGGVSQAVNAVLNSLLLVFW